MAAVFEGYPKMVRTKLLSLRRLIFDVASETEGIGDLEEALKWDQPGYLTTKSKSGSTIRIDRVKTHEGRYAIYFHCQTTLVETFRELYPNVFKYEENRSILFDVNDRLPLKELRYCIAPALTYHLAKKRKKGASVG